MPEQYEGIAKHPFLLLARLSKQQKTILGWLYVWESCPEGLRKNSWYTPTIGIRALRLACIPHHRERLKGAACKYYGIWLRKHRWHTLRTESASFSRSVSRLEKRQLIKTEKHSIRSDYRDYDEYIKHDAHDGFPTIVSFWKRSTQTMTIELTENGRKMAQQSLTKSMKRRITVNKNVSVSKNGGKNAKTRADQGRR